MSSNTELRLTVEAALDRCAKFDVRHIGVTTGNGIVCLSGQVGSYSERCAAQEVAQSVLGVKAIANDISSNCRLTHSTAIRISPRLRAKLSRQTAVYRRAGIKIIVREGCVELQGQVTEWRQRAEAENTVMSLQGVRTLVNNIFIQAAVSG